MTNVPQETRLPCPGCAKSVDVDPATSRSVTCPGCRREWRVQLFDAPGGRFVVELVAA